MPIFDRNDREVVRILDNQGREIETVYDQNGVIVYTNTTDMTGNTPLYFKGRGKPLKDYRIYGETLQDGTQSPDMPVGVVGCGEQTENLWDPSSTELERIFEIEPSTSYLVAKYHPLGANTGRVDISIYDSDMNLQNSDFAQILASVSLQGNSNTRYAKVQLSSVPSSVTDPWKYIYFGKGTGGGSYAPLFVPYGYKLPVTTTNGIDTVTTPIYIGTEPLHRIGEYADYVDYASGKIVRRIKKLALTGEEKWSTYGESFTISISSAAFRPYNVITVRCSHYLGAPNANAGSVARYDLSANFSITSVGLLITDRRFHLVVSDFKSYLSAQYAAGTPVTIWYVLENTIEEDPPVPFPELPTLSSINTMSVDTTVKPSQIYVKGKIKPNGYGKLVDKNGVYILDKDGVQLTVHGQGTSNA